MPRVLVADDNAAMRHAVRSVIEDEPGLSVVAEAPDGGAVLSLARRHRPDLVVVDVRMPGVDGLTVARRLAGPAVTDPIPVIVMTTYDLDEYVFTALQNGAAAFLLKETIADTLVPAIRAVLAGHALVSPAITRRLIDEYASVAPPVRPDEAVAGLSAREREVLLLIARGLTNAEVAATLVIEESTVKSHVTSLLDKTGLRSRVQLVIYAYQQGLVRVGRPRPWMT
jgi:DNA-binding NarL/FixJ family response regulator